MTRPLVTRDEILSNSDYAARRSELRAGILAEKERRRVHVGRYLTFLFENHDTMWYQIQEMLRIEGTTAENDVLHEMNTYNELLGGPADLGCTLLIEIDDPLQRDIVLRKWIDLPRYIYMRRADGSQARAVYDERQVGDDRLSAVQYLTFDVKGDAPTAIGLDAPDMEIEVALSDDQRAAFAADLS